MIFGLFVAVIIFSVLVVFPYTLYPLLLRFVPQVPLPVTQQDGKKASITLVFSAYNEARSIAEKLDNIARLKTLHPDLQVLAYDDGSSDGTLAAMQARPDLLQVIAGIGRQGKAHGMKQLVARATGDILVFTDANVLLDEDAIDRIRVWHNDPSIGGLCGSLRYLGEGRSTTASVGGAYWRLEEKIKDLESRTGNVMGADGSIFAIRRHLYPDFPDTVLDDLTVSMNVIFRGFRLVKCNDVIAYERLVVARRDEFSRKVRIAARAFHTHLFLRPQLRQMTGRDQFKYVSHKLIRWFGGLFLPLSALTFLALGFAVSFWAGVVASIAFSTAIILAAWGGYRPLDVVLEIALSMTATLLGVMKALRGQTFQTWAPAASR